MHRLRNVAAALLLSTVARAAPPPATVLVPLDGDKGARAVEKKVLEALKSLGVPASLGSLPLEDTRIAVDCPDTSPRCMTEVGKSLDAELLVYGTSKGTSLTLRAFDVRTSQDMGAVEFTLEEDAGPGALTARLRDLLRLKPEGALDVRSATPDVSIAIDGEARGTTPLHIEGLSEGRYRITATRAGYKPTETSVNVVGGETASVDVALEVDPDAVRITATGFVGRVRTRTWIVAGAGAGVAALGAVFGAMASSAQHDVDTRTIHGRGDYVDLQSRADSGKTYATLANVSIGVGVAALAAAGVLGWLDWRDARKRVEVSDDVPRSSRGRPEHVFARRQARIPSFEVSAAPGGMQVRW